MKRVYLVIFVLLFMLPLSLASFLQAPDLELNEEDSPEILVAALSDQRFTVFTTNENQVMRDVVYIGQSEEGNILLSETGVLYNINSNEYSQLEDEAMIKSLDLIISSTEQKKSIWDFLFGSVYSSIDSGFMIGVDSSQMVIYDLDGGPILEEVNYIGIAGGEQVIIDGSYATITNVVSFKEEGNEYAKDALSNIAGEIEETNTEYAAGPSVKVGKSCRLHISKGIKLTCKF
jgi:hypothetical protein